MENMYAETALALASGGHSVVSPGGMPAEPTDSLSPFRACSYVSVSSSPAAQLEQIGQRMGDYVVAFIAPRTPLLRDTFLRLVR
jgi:hypothetical protein